MHRGTPYIYQGEELGMTNAHFTRLEQYRDLESINMYHQRVDEAGIQSSESMMDALARRGRDNARTPMQWDASCYAGFTAEDAPTEPWISVNPNHEHINAVEEVCDSNSVYSFYKQLIALRHTNPVISAGDWQILDASNEQIYAFMRSLGDERVLVLVNVSGSAVDVPAESAAVLAASGLDEHSINQRLLLSTYESNHAVSSVLNQRLEAWEGIVLRID